jgi:hypothetical protein
MNHKYMILYLVAGTLALILLVYRLVTTYPAMSTGRIISNSLLAVAFFYLAYKTYHEKKDKEMM